MVLTRKESRKAEVLGAIAAFQESNGIPPSYRDLAAMVGIAHSAIHQIVQRLRTDGLIHDRNPKTSRAITLTDAGRRAVGL